MYQIDSAGNVAGHFTNGTPGVQAPTIVDADWLNAVQDELTNIVESAGIALDKEDSTQVLQALKTLFPFGGYQRDYAPGNAYANLTAFLAGTYVSLGKTRSPGGEIAENHLAPTGEVDSMLYSMVVDVESNCNVDVICALADDEVLLYVGGVLKHTWTYGSSTAPYTLALTAGTMVVQFLVRNTSANSNSSCFVNDWMTGNPVSFLRAAKA